MSIADRKYKWVSERAYCRSQQNSGNSNKENWYLAVQEFNAEYSIR